MFMVVVTWNLRLTKKVALSSRSSQPFLGGTLEWSTRAERRLFSTKKVWFGVENFVRFWQQKSNSGSKLRTWFTFQRPKAMLGSRLRFWFVCETTKTKKLGTKSGELGFDSELSSIICTCHMFTPHAHNACTHNTQSELQPCQNFDQNCMWWQQQELHLDCQETHPLLGVMVFSTPTQHFSTNDQKGHNGDQWKKFWFKPWHWNCFNHQNCMQLHQQPWLHWKSKRCVAAPANHEISARPVNVSQSTSIQHSLARCNLMQALDFCNLWHLSVFQWSFFHILCGLWQDLSMRPQIADWSLCHFWRAHNSVSQFSPNVQGWPQIDLLCSLQGKSEFGTMLWTWSVSEEPRAKFGTRVEARFVTTGNEPSLRHLDPSQRHQTKFKIVCSSSLLRLPNGNLENRTNQIWPKKLFLLPWWECFLQIIFPPFDCPAVTSRNLFSLMLSSQLWQPTLVCHHKTKNLNAWFDPPKSRRLSTLDMQITCHHHLLCPWIFKLISDLHPV